MRGPFSTAIETELLTFNDDIQGTAAVVLGALMGAVKVAGGSLRDQQIVFLGAGSASTGVADYLREAMVGEGLSDQEARGHFWMVNRRGVLHSGRRTSRPRSGSMRSLSSVPRGRRVMGHAVWRRSSPMCARRP